MGLQRLPRHFDLIVVISTRIVKSIETSMINEHLGLRL
jgi:hypothetical protein